MKNAVISTIVYSDIFDFPLTSDEIHRYLIYHKKTSPTAVNSTLKTLLRQEIINQRQDFYFLPQRQKLVEKRLHRQKISQKKLSRAKRVGEWLKLIPTISAVYLTGALAMTNADSLDDIDFFIITNPNRLWTTRLLVNTAFDLLKLRRRPQSTHVADKICLNLWLDKTDLTISSTKRNLYTAHEVTQAKKLWSRGDNQNFFLSQNPWVIDFLPNTLISNKSQQTKNPNKPIPITENISYNIQKNYMKSRITRETITPTKAFFHPKDTKNTILTAFQKKLKRFSL